MRPRAIQLIAFLCLLIPSAWYAWHWRALPHASEYHDDGIYFVGAKSLAETGRYEIISLPSHPAQTKYPPLWPAVLSIAWAIQPHYPENLPIAMILCWIWLPLTLLAYRFWLRQAGFSTGAVLLLCAIWALNPYVVLFSTTLLSELQFTFLLLVAVACMPKEHRNWALVAGLIAGLAFLSRTAGIALLPAALLYYGRQRQFHKAALFTAAMIPAVVGWVLWSMLHRATTSDAISIYYTNYFGFYLTTTDWSQFHIYLWKNVDGMLRSLGALLLPDTSNSLLGKVLAQSIGVFGVIGVVRWVRENRQGAGIPYAASATCFASVLIIWNFPPNERLVLPLAPLWIAGVYWELKRLTADIAKVFQKPERRQRIAGGFVTAAGIGILLFCVARQRELLMDGLPRYYQDHAEQLQQSEPAMEWIRANVPEQAGFLTDNDPLLFLRTGRVGANAMMSSIHWYRDDFDGRAAELSNIAAYAKKYNFGYVLLNKWDYERDATAEVHAKFLAAVRTDPRLLRVYAAGPTEIYQVR